MGQLGVWDGDRKGSNLEVADAIRDYLAKANGDTRLALAMSVADSLAIAQRARGAALGVRRQVQPTFRRLLARRDLARRSPETKPQG